MADHDDRRGAADEPREDRVAAAVAAPRSRAVVVAVSVLLVLIVASVLMLRGGDGRGARGVPAGETMPPFAAARVDSPVDGDVNLARRANAGAAGKVPACRVDLPGVVTSCALARRPVVLAFVTPDRRCVRELDVLERLARRHRGRLSVAAVAIRGDRERWRRMASGRWSFPLLYDRDGALSAAYSVQLCPQTTLARRGGKVTGTLFGAVSAAALERRARTLLD